MQVPLIVLYTRGMLRTVEKYQRDVVRSHEPRVIERPRVLCYVTWQRPLVM